MESAASASLRASLVAGDPKGSRTYDNHKTFRFALTLYNKMVNSSNGPAAKLPSWSADRILLNLTKNLFNWPLNGGQIEFD